MGAILGLTVLAWGNSIGDLVADLSVARAGSPNMAVTACFAGPLFNMLVGLGVSFSCNALPRAALCPSTIRQGSRPPRSSRSPSLFPASLGFCVQQRLPGE